MLEERKETMDKELKDTWKTKYEQNENINKETNPKQNQVEILELKTTIAKIKKFTRGIQQQI